MKEVLNVVHNRKAILRDRYGHTVAHAAHVGEGCYLMGSLWLEHQYMIYVYGGLFVIWICHTIIVGLD